MQALRLSSVKRDRRLDLMFLRCENDCSHAYVDPNMVNTAILTRCSVWYVTGSAFQVFEFWRMNIAASPATKQCEVPTCQAESVGFFLVKTV